ncbi:MAG: glycosyltransferase family 2 protein [Candidatus Hydrogenedentes bacterium]|nr:glycosyltransferase family 2 protein [Candidatus Hydrogenedentota bacterium]
MSTITVLTLVPDDCDRLPKCLESVRWADDLFCVVDARASEGTLALVRQFTDHAVVHEYVNAAAQRNWALPKIKTEWTLVLDADEWVSEPLAACIKKTIAEAGSSDGYDILRHSYFLGKLIRHCGWHRDYNLRLFRTEKGRYLDKRVHSKVVIDGKVAKINEVMYHDTYRTFDEFFNTFQRFTTWGAQDAFEQGKRAGMHDILLRPIQRFLKMYLWRLGFLDGYHGAVLCGLSSFSVFTKYAKLWQLRCEKKNSVKND